jgi:hypothetical protein
MNLSSTTLERRPEAMADVPGVCELPLTRAIVQYRDVHETRNAGGRIRDIGLGLVLEGRYASSAEVVDLGSADLKVLDLSAELVVLDWAYEPTHDHARRLVVSAAQGDRGDFRRFCWDLAFQVLHRIGYGPLSRSTLLRIGFRDICRDLDLHDGTSVRLAAGSGSGSGFRIHLDYDANALHVHPVAGPMTSTVERALARAFPSALPSRPRGDASPEADLLLRFPIPLGMGELRSQMAEIREGIASLLRRFEPRRAAAVQSLVSTFGRRETLARIHGDPTAADPTAAPVPDASSASSPRAPRTVH